MIVRPGARLESTLTLCPSRVCPASAPRLRRLTHRDSPGRPTRAYQSSSDFQSYMGPGDKYLASNDSISGNQPVSRIGEIVLNAFVDPYEFSTLAHDYLTAEQLHGHLQTEARHANDASSNLTHDQSPVEYKPMFHEWATVHPGLICLSRKKKTAAFRQYAAVETAVPVIACAACLPKDDEKNYFFAGIARSKSVRSPDDGIGPNVDEFFTVSIGGMQQIINTSNGPIFPGDLIEWTFANGGTAGERRSKSSPRRIAVSVASVSSPKIIGKALSFAKKGETFDILIRT